VIPCYNYGHYLPTAVRSVLEQSSVDVEVIVIDDASPDGSAAVVQGLAADGRVRAILHRSNRGHVATYNEGLEEATGDYVVLLSADDALAPGSLARATALLEAQPSVGLVYGHPIVFDDEPPTPSGHIRNWTIWTGEDWIGRRCRTSRNCIMNPEVVMRTSVQRAIGGYDANLPHSGDFEMWLRAASVSDVGRVNGPAQGFYRVHSESMQRTTYAGALVDLEGRLAAFEKVLSDSPARIGRRDALLAVAKRALAVSALECARSAFDHGRATKEPVDDYLAFAARVWPAVRQTRKWRALTRCTAAHPYRFDRGLGPIVRRTTEDLRWRVRWRRWRWTGV
jgi:glycosyltransferase involved in cell wall biosynthesis